MFEVFANLTLCQGLLPNANITVIGVSWTLAVIFVFYMLFPFFCFLIGNKKRAWGVAVAALMFNWLCSSYFSAGRGNIVYDAIYFIAGGLIFLYRKELAEFASKHKVIAGVILLIATVVYFAVGGYTLMMLLFCVAALPSVVQFSAAVILAGQVVFIFGTKGIKKNIGLLWIPLMIFFYVRNNPNIKFYSLTYIQVLLLFVCCILFSASGGFNDRCWMIKMVSSWRYLYFIYIAFTIYMFLDSSAINFVCNLFPDAASTILNQYHNAGIPGLTKHYSTNGMLLAVGTMIFGSYALTEKRRSDYLLFLISVAALLLSGKRAHTVFGLTALYLCYFAYNSNAKKSRLVKCIGVLLGALTVFAVASYCVPALATVVFRFIDTAETGDMSVGRVDVWLKAFSMFGKHSLVGIGWGQYVNQGGWFWNIHNIYIQLLVETGIIGFIIYCGWFLFHLVRT